MLSMSIIKCSFLGTVFESCPNIFFKVVLKSVLLSSILKFYLTLGELLCLAQVGSSIMDELISATFFPLSGRSIRTRIVLQQQQRKRDAVLLQGVALHANCALSFPSRRVYKYICVCVYCVASCYATLEVVVAWDGWRIWDIQSPPFSFFLASASSYSFPWWKLNEAGPRKAAAAVLFLGWECVLLLLLLSKFDLVLCSRISIHFRLWSGSLLLHHISKYWLLKMCFNSRKLPAYSYFYSHIAYINDLFKTSDYQKKSYLFFTGFN